MPQKGSNALRCRAEMLLLSAAADANASAEDAEAAVLADEAQLMRMRNWSAADHHNYTHLQYRLARAERSSRLAAGRLQVEEEMNEAADQQLEMNRQSASHVFAQLERRIEAVGNIEPHETDGWESAAADEALHEELEKEMHDLVAQCVVAGQTRAETLPHRVTYAHVLFEDTDE
eukprot:6877313-Prymnesium_polylepis.1